MTDEERYRALLSKLGMECIELGCVYRDLGRSLGAFGTRVELTRPDEVREIPWPAPSHGGTKPIPRAAKIKDEIGEANPRRIRRRS